MAHSAWAIDLYSLSASELSAIKKLGFTESEINSFDEDALKSALKEKLEYQKDELLKKGKEKLQEVVKEKIAPKLEELKTKIEKEKESLKKDAVKLAGGYLTSTVSLFAATLIAPQAIMVCKTKPSAVIYAGSAAVYVLQEMRNIKILKASQLAEIEMVNGYTADKTKSVKENAKILESKVDQQVGYLQAYKGTIVHAVNGLKKKAKNAKMVSIGFLASSAAAAAEQMDWISGGGACVASSGPFIERLQFSPQLDRRYAVLIETANKTEDKWAYYYEWESLKFGVNRSLSWKEYNRLKDVSVSDSILVNAMNVIHSHLLASAFAAEDSKKVTVMGSLKNNKAADWLGDLDKLGIAGGVATSIVAYMAGWQMSFLKSIMASGTSRAITFGAQGALAFTAGKLFEDAATELGQKLDKIDRLIFESQNLAQKGINTLVPSDADAVRFQEIAAKLGVTSNKLITAMSLNEAQDYLDRIKNKVEKLDDEGKALIKKYEVELSEKLKEKKIETKEKVKVESVYLPLSFPLPHSLNFLDLFFPSAEASTAATSSIVTRIRDIDCVERKSCPPLSFIKSNNSNLKLLNQYLGLFERYYQGVTLNNPAQEYHATGALEANKKLITNYRNTVFQKSQEQAKAKNTNYNDFEKAKIAQESSMLSAFYSALSIEERQEMEEKLNPASGNYAIAKIGLAPRKQGSGTLLSSDELKIVGQLISRLGSPAVSGPDMSFVERETAPEEEFNFGNTSIHPKESELFEIIHSRYLQFLKKNFNDL